MYSYGYRPKAFKQLEKLPQTVQKRIIQKLDFFVNTSDPLEFAEHLKNRADGSYRFRIGDYRVIFDIEDKQIVILHLGHRREIYK